MGISTALLLVVGCSQLSEPNRTQQSGSTNTSPPVTVSTIDLSASVQSVVVVDGTIDGQPTATCVVHRIAASIADEKLEDSIRERLLQRRSGVAPDPLEAISTNQSQLTSEEAAAAYNCVSTEIESVMSESPHAIARLFSTWRKIEGPPFYEDQLGGRYVAVYANDQVETGTDVGAFVDRGIAVGGILATPSVVVDETGIVSPGPMVLAEKMPRGFTPAFGNYRYTILDAGGQVVATTNGLNKEMIALCDRCTDHGADRLFFALLNASATDDSTDPPPEAPRTVYEEPPQAIYGAPASDAFLSPEPGSLEDPLEGEVLDPDAVFDDDVIDPLDLEVDLDPSVDLLAQ